jgi:hypothetical protein
MSAGLVALAALLELASPVRAAVRPSSTCVPVVVGLDTSYADTILYAIDSRGYGQVILVRDTLVSSVTAWKPAQPDTFPTPAVLYVTNVDSTGFPNTFGVLYTSPVTGGPFGDGIHPIPLTFNIDPPLVLPGRGRYFFVVVQQNVAFGMCIGVVRLLGNKDNAYADGGGFKTGISGCDSSGPGGVASPPSNLDMIFQITFCNTSTPVRHSTWGELKSRYH